MVYFYYLNRNENGLPIDVCETSTGNPLSECPTNGQLVYP